MNAKQAIRASFATTDQVLNGTIGDLSDADFLVRPVPNANHIAWQIGHLIVSEVGLMKPLGLTFPAFPEGFEAQHSKETAALEPPLGFHGKEQYLEIWKGVRAVTLSALETIPEADLDKPNTGNMASFAPTFGHLFLLTSTHPMMHVGQFSVVRRKLGKPVLF